jgi:hypothetical protein
MGPRCATMQARSLGLRLPRPFVALVRGFVPCAAECWWRRTTDYATSFEPSTPFETTVLSRAPAAPATFRRLLQRA